MRGGYQASSRIETNTAESIVTLMEWRRAPTRDERKRALRELAELMNERFALLGHAGLAGA